MSPHLINKILIVFLMFQFMIQYKYFNEVEDEKINAFKSLQVKETKEF